MRSVFFNRFQIISNRNNSKYTCARQYNMCYCFTWRLAQRLYDFSFILYSLQTATSIIYVCALLLKHTNRINRKNLLKNIIGVKFFIIFFSAFFRWCSRWYDFIHATHKGVLLQLFWRLFTWLTFLYAFEAKHYIYP